LMKCDMAAQPGHLLHLRISAIYDQHTFPPFYTQSHLLPCTCSECGRFPTIRSTGFYSIKSHAFGSRSEESFDFCRETCWLADKVAAKPEILIKTTLIRSPRVSVCDKGKASLQRDIPTFNLNIVPVYVETVKQHNVTSTIK
jgi:hypothetical protein